MSAQPKPLSANRNGVLRIVRQEDRQYYVAADVMDLLGVSRPKAYKVIRALREELISEGHLISEYPCGRIPKKYFNDRCGIDL